MRELWCVRRPISACQGLTTVKLARRILAAKFEWVNTVQEAFDAKLAEGRNELPQ